MTEETGNPWQEWLAQQSPIKGLPKRITIMHKMYGISAGHTCGKCALMLRRKFSATYLKCSRSTMTRGAATDWRASWPACGLFQQGEGSTEHGD